MDEQVDAARNQIPNTFLLAKGLQPAQVVVVLRRCLLRLTWSGSGRGLPGRGGRPFLHPEDAVGEGLICGASSGSTGAARPGTLRVKDHRVGQLVAHLLDLFLLLLLLGLLGDLEEVRVENLVRVQRVRVRVVLLVIGLVHALELVVALG